MVKATSTTAIERASGLGWSSWTRHLDSLGGASLSHAQLAAAAKQRLTELGVERSDWWAQGIAVAYEQAIGRRAPGQRADGSHEMSVSKTFGRDLDHTLETWIATVADAADHRGLASGAATVTSSEKWRYWRTVFTDGTKLVVTIGLRANGKPYAAVTHSGFDGGDRIEAWATYWRERLADAAVRARTE